jgi:hypothetical protein
VLTSHPDPLAYTRRPDTHQVRLLVDQSRPTLGVDVNLVS